MPVLGTSEKVSKSDGFSGPNKWQSLFFGHGMTETIEALMVPIAAIVVSLGVFGIFVSFLGVNPLELYHSIYKGAFGSWFSWQNTLQRAAPLMLAGLCTAIPARLGLIVIGGEGAIVVGAVATVIAAAALAGAPSGVVILGMFVASMAAGGFWIGIAGALRYYRNVNETISTLLLNYIAIALMSQLVNGWIRDTEVVHRPSSWHIGEENMLGPIFGSDLTWGLPIGVAACLILYVVMQHTVFGFSSRIVGGNPRAAKIVGLKIGKLIILSCVIGGAAAGLAGMAEIVTVQGRVSSSIVVGYGYTGILIAFIARHNPLAIIPAAILLGGIRASGGLLQRYHDLPDATTLVLQGIMFVAILISEPTYQRLKQYLASRRV